jgi:uncharacterized phiE125 gp8 family phage protein
MSSLVKTLVGYPYLTEGVLTLDEAKDFLHVTSDDEDDLIQSLVDQATAYFQDAANIQLCEAGYEFRLDAFPSGEIKIPRGPLVSVESITYIDSDGNEQTLDAAEYDVDIYDPTGRVCPAYNETWPTTRAVMNAVCISYTAGFGDSADVPETAKGALRLLIGHWYRNREAMLTGTISKEIELGVERLKWLLRRH